MQVPAAADASAGSGAAATTNGSTAAASAAAAAPSGGTDAASEAAAAVAAAESARPHEDSFAAVADCVGFRKQRGATLVRAADGTMHGGDLAPAAGEPASGAGGAGAGAGAGAGDFALEELEGCEVRLLCGSTALWIRRLRNCTVVALPLPGSVYMSECTDCTFVFGARQVRLHTSSRCDFYLHAASHPIIERCDAFRFAPYPSPLPPAFAGAVAAAGMDPTRNEWSNVDDFGWLKATASPHWCVLPEAERRSDFDFFTPPSAGGTADGTAGGTAASSSAAAPAAPAAAASTAAVGEITLKVLFFAAAREEAGTSEVSLAVAAGTDTEALRATLLARFPALEPLLPRCALARNSSYVEGVATLAHGDEVAVIPPVSGG